DEYIDFVFTTSFRGTYELLKVMDNQTIASPYLPPRLELNGLSKPKERLKIAYSYESPIGSEVNQSTIDSLNDTVEKLKKLGHEVVEDTVPVDGQQAIHSYFTMNMVETAAMFKDME